MRTDDLNYGPDYWESLDGGAGYTDSPIWEDLAHIIMETFGAPNLRLLDVGCAAGFLIRHMRRRGVETFGCDISEYALNLAPPEWRLFMTQLDLTVDGSMHEVLHKPFKLVTCLETFEHIPESSVGMAVANVKLAMEPDGLALLSICLDSVPNWQSDPTHINMHSREWWEGMLAFQGLVQHDAAERQIRHYKMFQDHPGVFVVSKA